MSLSTYSVNTRFLASRCYLMFVARDSLCLGEAMVFLFVGTFYITGCDRLTIYGENTRSPAFDISLWFFSRA